MSFSVDKRRNDIDVPEVMDVVARREAVIRTLLAEPKHKCDLQDELGVSRSTVYKAIRELESLNLVERGTEGYEPTLVGRLFFEEYERFCSKMESICASSQLLSVLPPDTDIPSDVVDGAELDLAKRHAPNRPVRSFEEMVREADALKGCSPVVLPQYVELFHEQTVDGDLKAKLVLEQPVVEHLTDNYGLEFCESLTLDTVTVRVTESELAYGLVVVEEPTPVIGVMIHDRGGELRGFITNDTADALEWGHDVWERHVSETRRVNLD